MTIRELMQRLSEFPPDMEVVALWDTIPDFTIHRVELHQGRAVIDCGENDGDWDVVAASDMERVRGHH